MIQRFDVTSLGQLEQALRSFRLTDDSQAQVTVSQDPKWRESILDICQNSVITATFGNNQFSDPMQVPAIAVKGSPLDPTKPCKFCRDLNVHIEELIPTSALNESYKDWSSSTPMGLAHLAAVASSAAINQDDKKQWFSSDRASLPTGVDAEEWVERSLRVFVRKCEHLRYILPIVATSPLVYNDAQPINVTADPVARDLEHLAVHILERTFMVRNRIVILGGANAQALAHALGKDVQHVEAPTSEALLARATKLFPTRITRLAIIWPTYQKNLTTLMAVLKEAVEELLRFNHVRVLLLGPASHHALPHRFITDLQHLSKSRLAVLSNTIGNITSKLDGIPAIDKEDVVRPSALSLIKQLVQTTVQDTLHIPATVRAALGTHNNKLSQVQKFQPRGGELDRRDVGGSGVKRRSDDAGKGRLRSQIVVPAKKRR
ncbi:hypothetical protein AAVH_29724 [Aphelenchoides avenae]|nr:hypothetical protein AAVH_29724 [Aphelenchus avenae]